MTREELIRTLMRVMRNKQVVELEMRPVHRVAYTLCGVITDVGWGGFCIGSRVRDVHNDFALCEVHRVRLLTRGRWRGVTK